MPERAAIMKTAVKSVGLPGACLFLAFVLSGMTGCNKSCPAVDEELQTYLLNKAPVGDKAKLKEKCKDIAKKCSSLSSPHELMGDLDASEKRYEEALGNYGRALVINPDSQRIQEKMASTEGALAAMKQQSAVQERMRIANISVSEYIKLDRATRLDWCEARIENAQAGLGEVNSTSPFATRLSTTPQALDYDITAEASRNPNQKVLDASYKALLKNMKTISQ